MDGETRGNSFVH